MQNSEVYNLAILTIRLINKPRVNILYHIQEIKILSVVYRNRFTPRKLKLLSALSLSGCRCTLATYDTELWS